MNDRTLQILEFPAILAQVADLALSGLGRSLAGALTPRTQAAAVAELLRETSEARWILESAGAPPLYGLADLSETFRRAEIGAVLDPLALQGIADFLRGCRKTREFMLKRLDQPQAAMVAGYALGLVPLPELETEIERCIRDGQVADDASPELRRTRREMARLQDRIQSKLQQLLAAPAAREWLQEAVVSFKEGRYVLLVKAAQRQKVPGAVVGSSGSGATLFIEPQAVTQYTAALRQLEAAEQEEVRRILAQLSAEVAARIAELSRDLEIMAQYDLAFAKARFSRASGGVAPALNETGRIRLAGARHPLLAGTPVPLDLAIGQDYRSLVITGPNTGGKTVALKTVGLLTLMAQAGLHIPAAAGSELAVFEEVLADIGDGQSIAQSLSTFSAHITNIIAILGQCGQRSLVLIDEVGTGTDPAEGAALATAILEYLYQRGAVTLASTHYPEIKQYALTAPGFRNGAMAFDRQNLKPLYRLVVGQPGASQALWIAAKLGMFPEILANAEARLAGASSLRQPDPAAPPEASALPDGPVEPAPPAASAPPEAVTPAGPAVKIGDMVSVPFLAEKGVVCTAPDAKGRIRVLIKGKKMELPLQRVELLIPAEQLYPADYDLNIVLLTKEERRLKHQMGRKHLPGVARVVSPEEQ
ncbi:MutS2 family protein [Hydrogenispora ethanolica]|uniref:MutS2 family protein n=1 Tax=Hydrogenispora ethanolica TaxID=1082276 RepID=A0A4R1SBG7_HYDET|nr:hypothetical protein [Hydrogenispora ethanolica]TCL76893.1 MutS2 family protein [Hydrogenispora ethanolica]